jgi:lysophospholipase L1-like esterase
MYPEIKKWYPEHKTKYMEFGMDAVRRNWYLGGGLNPYTKAFINAIETDAVPTILTGAQKTAVNNLVKDLLVINTVQSNFFRPDSLTDSVLKVFYPFLSNNVNANKYNLLNPANTDAANRLTIVDTVDFTNGFKSNGTSGYGNTYLNYSGFNTNDVAFGYYKNESTLNVNNKVPTGVISGTYYVYGRFIINDLSGSNSIAGTDKSNVVKSATDIGLFINNYRSDKSQFILGDNLVESAANQSGAFPSRTAFVGAVNSGGSPNYYCPDNICCLFIGKGISDSAISLLKTAIYRFIKALNRSKRVYYFNGDSITRGNNASPSTNRFSTLLAVDCNAKEINNGISGEMMSNYLTGASGHNFYDKITANSGNNALIDYYQDSDSLVFLNHGVNEPLVDNFVLETSLTQWEYAIDFIHTVRKWPYGNIVLTGPFVKLGVAIEPQQAYNQALKTMAEAKGCIYVNVFDSLYGTTGYIDTDNIHLTNAGHLFVKNLIYSKLQQTNKL